MNIGHAIFEALHGLRHRWQAKIRHGVHSPFVFGLQDGALKDAALTPIPAIEHCRKKLLLDARKFQRVDLGAGSRKGKANETKVSAFARRSLQKEHPARILRGLADAVQANHVIELGTALGITTAYLAWERSQRKVVTIEGDPFVLAVAREHWQSLKIENIDARCGDFDHELQGHDIAQAKWDMVLVDGNHTYAATMRYWHFFRDKLSERGCLVFDDLYWSPEMHRAWREIIADPAVGLSLDYFDFGVVFLFPRRQQEHYVLGMPTAAARTKYI